MALYQSLTPVSQSFNEPRMKVKNITSNRSNVSDSSGTHIPFSLNCW